ncbi:MAG TPA: response regulator transcription factor [Xanthomonadaceae bacterium]|nr:response regulator transcription factor [Xanthomonadaceae bacterium]
MDPVPAKLRILLIEDQRPMAENIWEYLESCGQVMDHAADGQAGLQLALDNTYDVIVLDIGLPKLDGIEVCRRYRAQGGTTPILMLTARDRIEDKLLGFEAGADDYLTKPFELRELAARVQVLHKRQQRQSPAVLRIGDLALDVIGRGATRQDEPLSLSPAGFRLLEALMRNSPNVMRYGELAQALWGDTEHDPARLHTHVSLLRAAVDRAYDQPLIVTVHGFGYRIVPPAAT